MGNESSTKDKTINIICPKCPLTPIISISLNEESILTCEYRCPYMHFGLIPLEDIDKDKENKHGKFCGRCTKPKPKAIEEECKKESKSEIQEELLFCGTCKQFICNNCRPNHEQEKESHKILIPKSKLNYLCLEHGESYIGFCFTCLISICKNCKRHEKHCKKLFEDFYPEDDFISNYKYYLKDYSNYLKSIGKSKGMNKEQFNRFKARNQILINLTKDLFNIFEEKKKNHHLNGEVIINLLNVINFNYKATNLDSNESFVNYCKKHLILSNKPISDICTFSKTKADYNLSKLIMEEFTPFNNTEIPSEYKYSPTGRHIIFSSGCCLHFLSTEKSNEEEKAGFKIRFEKKISSFNIFRGNILCVCCSELRFYELLRDSPFYRDIINQYNFPLDISNSPPLEIVGNLDKNILIRTTKSLILVNNENGRGKYEITATMDLENVNKEVTEEKTVIDESRRYDYYYDYNQKRTKKITINKQRTTKIKAIVNDYIVLIESGIITTRSINKLSLIDTLNSYKDIDCLVFNGNVILFNENNILFFSIPKLEKISCLTVADNVLSINLVNRKTLIVVEEKYVEQFEANTWKRLWRQISMGEEVNNSSLVVIGAGKELFFFHKDRKMFYKLVVENEEKKKK